MFPAEEEVNEREGKVTKINFQYLMLIFTDSQDIIKTHNYTV